MDCMKLTLFHPALNDLYQVVHSIAETIIAQTFVILNKTSQVLVRLYCEDEVSCGLVQLVIY